MIKHAIFHHLDAPTSRKAVERAFAQYEGRYRAFEPKLRWKSERQAELSARVRGVPLGGALALEDGRMNVEVEVPLLLRPLERRAIAALEREARRWLAHPVTTATTA